MVDARYTADDHRFRDQDAYAGGKYRITLDWLRAGSLHRRRLLNVGCGGGLFNSLAAAEGYIVEACDPDPDAALLAKESAPDGVTVQQAGLLDVQLHEPVDAIVLHDVLEHIADDALAVQRLHALSEPGGMVILSVPALPWLFGVHDELLGHHRRYTKATLRAVLEPHFEIEKLRYYGMLFIPITWWLSKVRRTPYPAETATTGAVGHVFRAVCRAEAVIPTPIGTSLICRLRQRSLGRGAGPERD